MLLNVSARPRNGLTFQGGVNTGKTVSDYVRHSSRAAGVERHVDALGSGAPGIAATTVRR